MRVVILGSAEIKNYEKISRFINPEDFIIACDSGLNHVKKLGLSPSAVNLVVGDFDSHSRPVNRIFHLQKSFSYLAKKTTPMYFLP